MNLSMGILRTENLAKESFATKMVPFTGDHLRMVYSMAKEYSNGNTDRDMKVFGRMGSTTDLGYDAVT